jgi:peroxiredoxin
MKYILTFLVAIFLIFNLSFSQDSLKVGDPAPDFALPYATKDSVAQEDLKLSSLIGKKNIVLAFYPANWSGGCTIEMCTMRDNFSELTKLDAEILPISGDYEYSHHEWAKQQNFPFKMLSDHLHKVARTYHSYNETSGYNKRTVFVIDKKGKIAYIDLAYKARDPESFKKLQEALKKLQ